MIFSTLNNFIGLVCVFQRINKDDNKKETIQGSLTLSVLSSGKDIKI